MRSSGKNALFLRAQKAANFNGKDERRKSTILLEEPGF